jgi:hypothetical protein
LAFASAIDPFLVVIGRLMRVVSAFALLILVVFAAAMAAPRANADLAVAVSPFADPARVFAVVAAADGRVLRPSRFGWVVLVAAGRPDMVTALYGAGAWLVFDPRVAGGCL